MAVKVLRLYWSDSHASKECPAILSFLKLKEILVSEALPYQKRSLFLILFKKPLTNIMVDVKVLLPSQDTRNPEEAPSDK